MPTMTPALKRANSAPPQACASLPDADVMFPLHESRVAGQRTAGEAAAVAVCARCPVLERCFEAALEAEMPYGVVGGLTVADRRAIRARRRALDPIEQSATMTASPRIAGQRTAGEAKAPSPAGPTSQDTALESVLAAQGEFGHGADLSRVRELVAGRGPAVASRWEVALAAATLLRLGRSVSATARVLGEQYTQVKRWHDRDQQGGALILGQKGVGTTAIARPAALIDAPSTSAGAAVSTEEAA